MTRLCIMGAILCAAALAALPLLAETINISGTTVTISPGYTERMVAEITMRNDLSNGPMDEGNYSLTDGDTTVDVRFDWDAEGTADAITVTPPDGTYCLPRSCVLQLNEDDTGSLWIMEWAGM